MFVFASDLGTLSCEESDVLKHCWKKKRDFRIIRSKVGGFLTQSVGDNEYFVGWKKNMVDRYHLKWLPIIC